MAVAEISLTLEEELVNEARSRAGQGDLSVYVSAALKRQLQHDRIDEMLREMDRESGPIDPAVMDQVRKEWPAPTSQDG